MVAAAEMSQDTMIPDLLSRHPQARVVLDRYGLRGCGGRLGPVESLRFFARTHGVDESTLLTELDAAVHKAAQPVAAALPENLADTIYRRFFLAGIAMILSAGASWGAWLLWQIGFAGKFTGVSVLHVNAHGQAQIYGWCGLFIMGFACQAFPRLWHTDLWRPRIAVIAFVLMLAGLAMRTFGMIGESSSALASQIVGGTAQIAAVSLFAAQIVITFRRSSARLEPYVGFVIASLAFFLAATVLDQWHTYKTMTAASREALLWQVATWQAPLRDLQIHGMALCIIFGVSLRMLPALFGVRALNPRRAWKALWILSSAVVLEIAIFLAYRYSQKHAIAALLMIPWAMLAAGTWMVAAPFQLWRRPPIRERSVKFVRAAYAWLALSLVMLLLLPLHQKISGIAFSHAYYGAIRHAITVGFVSLMIMGMAAKVVPTLNGRDTQSLTGLWGPFLLINLGCFLRVTLQTLTDLDARFFAAVGISGVLEVAALAWWGAGLARLMLARKRDAMNVQVPVSSGRISAEDNVNAVITRYPQTLEVFLRFGFSPLASAVLRRTLARSITIRQAASLKDVSLQDLLSSLNSVVSD